MANVRLKQQTVDFEMDKMYIHSVGVRERE